MMSIGETSKTVSSKGMGKRSGKRPGRKPAKIDERAKLERSRQSARECRARKKLRYQYLEELVLNREKAVFTLRDELDMYKQWCLALDNDEPLPESLLKRLAEDEASRRRPDLSMKYSQIGQAKTMQHQFQLSSSSSSSSNSVASSSPAVSPPLHGHQPSCQNFCHQNVAAQQTCFTLCQQQQQPATVLSMSSSAHLQRQMAFDTSYQHERHRIELPKIIQSHNRSLHNSQSTTNIQFQPTTNIQLQSTDNIRFQQPTTRSNEQQFITQLQPTKGSEFNLLKHHLLLPRPSQNQLLINNRMSKKTLSLPQSLHQLPYSTSPTFQSSSSTRQRTVPALNYNQTFERSNTFHSSGLDNFQGGNQLPPRRRSSSNPPSLTSSLRSTTLTNMDDMPSSLQDFITSHDRPISHLDKHGSIQGDPTINNPTSTNLPKPVTDEDFNFSKETFHNNRYTQYSQSCQKRKQISPEFYENPKRLKIASSQPDYLNFDLQHLNIDQSNVDNLELFNAANLPLENWRDTATSGRPLSLPYTANSGVSSTLSLPNTTKSAVTALSLSNINTPTILSSPSLSNRNTSTILSSSSLPDINTPTALSSLSSLLEQYAVSPELSTFDIHPPQNQTTISHTTDLGNSTPNSYTGWYSFVDDLQDIPVSIQTQYAPTSSTVNPSIQQSTHSSNQHLTTNLSYMNVPNIIDEILNSNNQIL